MIFFFIAVVLFLLVIASFFKGNSKNSKEIRLQPNVDSGNFNPIALIIDTETTGLINDNSIRITKKNVTEISNNFPRIVQISYMLIDEKGNYEGENFYIKQNDKIPKEAIKIHKITDEKCEKDGIQLEDALRNLISVVSKVDNIVGHNISFDYKVLHAEYVRCNIGFPLQNKNKIDTMKLVGKQLGFKYGYKLSLYNSAEKLFGKNPIWQNIKVNLKEHDAESDVIVTALLFQLLYKK